MGIVREELIAAGSEGTHVPRKQDQDGTQRDLADVSLESLFGFSGSIRQALAAHFEHVVTAQRCRVHFFGCVRDRATHLVGDLLRQLIAPLPKQRQRFLDNLLAILKRGLAEALESFQGSPGDGRDLGIGGALAFDHRFVR